MKFKIITAILFLAVSTAFAQKQKFEINGTIDESSQNKKLYFSRMKMNGIAQPEVKSVSVKNGKFLIKGELEEPEQAVFSFNQDMKPDSTTFRFLIDQGTISVKIADNLPSSKASGSKANEDFDAYLSNTRSATQEFNEFYKSLEQQALKGGNRDSLRLVFQNAYDIYKKEIHDIRLAFIKSNPGAFVSLLLLPDIAEYSQNYQLVDSLYHALSNDIKQKPSSKIIYDRFQEARKLSIGAIAPEFSQANTDGKQIKLTDFRGKYVLLDFWASWCGPCRRENPHVVKVFNQFKDKNFTVLGISLDGPGARSAWLKAIADDKLTWTQVSDLNMWKNEAALLYNVTSIPQNFLIDPNGKIVAKNLRGEQLENELAKILNKNN